MLVKRRNDRFTPPYNNKQNFIIKTKNSLSSLIDSATLKKTVPENKVQINSVYNDRWVKNININDYYNNCES